MTKTNPFGTKHDYLSAKIIRIVLYPIMKLSKNNFFKKGMINAYPKKVVSSNQRWLQCV